jgi:hypothetical protein
MRTRANLEDLKADGAAGGIGEFGRVQADAAQPFDQHIGHRGKPQEEEADG